MTQQGTSTICHEDRVAEGAYRKIGWRILPFLLLCYVLAFLDRINISFAQESLQKDLKLSVTAYGVGAGIFFLGYVLCEVPSNLLLTRIGMRKTVSRIMILWGIASTSMMLINGEKSFYLTRVLLGVFEAGFAPAMFYYCSQWFPRQRIATALAVLGMTGPIAGVMGAPTSAALITHMNGVAGLAGWRWLFLVEGLPSVLVGVLAWFIIVDKPNQARWLTPAEKAAVEQIMKHDRQSYQESARTSLSSAAKDSRLYLLILGYFCFIAGMYLPHYWLPRIVQQAGFSGMSVGWLVAVPSLGMLVTIIPFARHSDRLRERRWHTAVPMAISACLLCLVTLAVSGIIALPFGVFYGVLTAALVSMYLAYVVFWAIPRELFASGPIAAGGIALINSLGLCGGFLSPMVVGWLNQTTGNMAMAFLLFTVTVAVGAIAFALIRPSGDT